MSEITTIVTLSLASLAGLGILTAAGLSGWRGWLDLQRLSLIGQRDMAEMAAPPPAGARIELADLKERVRKLEAIAAGIDL